jgi:hypothetical protein
MDQSIPLINQFISSTAHLLNQFSGLYESKIFEIDKELDNVEATLSIFEEKVNSLPQNLFDNLQVDYTTAVQPTSVNLNQHNEQLNVSTDTTLMMSHLADANNGPPAPPPAGGAPPPAPSQGAPPPPPPAGGSGGPPPPPPPPPGMKSNAPPPPPGAQPAGPPAPAAPPGPPQPPGLPGQPPSQPAEGDAAAPVEAADEPEMSPEEAKRAELLANPDFKVYLRMIKMRIPKVAICHKIMADNIFDPDDIEVFKKDMERAGNGLPLEF